MYPSTRLITADKLLMKIPVNRFLLSLRFLSVISLLFIFNIATSQEATTYDEAIIYGDKNIKTSSLMDAKAYYQQALKLKPGDDYAKSQISVIVDKMKMAMAIEDEYYDIIDFADELYDQNKLTQAVSEYNKALKIIPNDEYALARIREIREFEYREKEKIDNFNKAMETGKVYLSDEDFGKAIEQFTIAAEIFPSKELPITELSRTRNLQKEFDQKEALFELKYDEAERYLLIKNYSESLKLFRDAQKIIPDNVKAIDKITLLIPLAQKEITFNVLIENADEYYISQDFISAQREYIAASKAWPEKSYPRDMILKINEKLESEKQDIDNNFNNYVISGDSLMISNEYALALGKYNLALNLKPNNSYPKKKIAEIEGIYAENKKAFEINYNKMISSADSAFSKGAYAYAKVGYETALELKPEDSYPREKLTELEDLESQIAAQQKINADYNKLITQADDLFNSGNYDMAISKYKEAQLIKSVENYPVDQIVIISGLLANAEKQRELDEKYNELITVAFQQFNQDKLADSKRSYLNASELKPMESMPKLQIAAIDSMITIRKKEADVRKKYDVLLTKGDEYKSSKDYQNALNTYNEALLLIPGESIDISKKKEVETIQVNIRRETERKKSYEDAITKGDKFFGEGSYELSKIEFIRASKLYSDKDYPRQRLDDISKELERVAAEKEERYLNSIAEADVFYDRAEYENALEKYILAKSIKPDASYPKNRITECDKYIAERKALLMEDYKIAIAEAEKFYNGKIYDKAILAFRKAQQILPSETYPDEMITQIIKFIEENSIVDIINTVDTIFMGSTDKLNFSPVKISVRKSNYIFLKAKNLSDKATKLIFSYGSDGSKNGGFVVQVIESNGYNDYIVRVGNQYKWFSEDNNWLTIHPENGDVEISMLRISKGY